MAIVTGPASMDDLDVDPIRVAAELREERVRAAREEADREFVAIIRDEMQRSTIVEIAARAGFKSRGNIFRLLKMYPPEGGGDA